jgi:hypothetical protein
MPRWHYELRYNYLKDSATDLVVGLSYSDYKTLMAFFLKHLGAGDTWLFNDVFTPDYYIGPAKIGSTPNQNARLQLLLNTEDSLYYSPIQRSMGGYGVWMEDVLDLNGTLAVYANGTLQTVGAAQQYVIEGPGLAIPGYSFTGKYIKWHAAYTPASPITVQGNFYWRCRFEEDRMDFEKFMYELWAAGGDPGGSPVKFLTTREYT